MLFEIGAQFLAAHGQQRAEDLSYGGMNAAEAGEAGTAQDMCEDGFGLVVGGVGHGNARAAGGVHEGLEKGVAGAAGGVFEIGAFFFCFVCHVGGGRMKFQGMTGGQLGHELFVGIGETAAKFVIEVGDDEDEAEFFAEFEEEQQEGDGVRTAGDGGGDALARANPELALERSRKPGR